MIDKVLLFVCLFDLWFEYFVHSLIKKKCWKTAFYLIHSPRVLYKKSDCCVKNQFSNFPMILCKFSSAKRPINASWEVIHKNCIPFKHSYIHMKVTSRPFSLFRGKKASKKPLGFLVLACKNVVNVKVQNAQK